MATPSSSTVSSSKCLQQGHQQQALDRDRSTAYLECECSYRRAEEEEEGEQEEKQQKKEIQRRSSDWSQHTDARRGRRRFNVSRVLVYNDPPALSFMASLLLDAVFSITTSMFACGPGQVNAATLATFIGWQFSPDTMVLKGVIDCLA
jgi:hypothetical protein